MATVPTPTRPARPHWLASAVLHAYACLLLPFLGGFAAGWVAYELFGLSYSNALWCWIGVAVLAFRMRLYSLRRVGLLSWAGVASTMVLMGVLALAPVAAYALVYWPVLTYSQFPALLPALAVAGFVGYMAHEFARTPLQQPTPPRPEAERGRAAGGLFEANEQAHTETREDAYRRILGNIFRDKGQP